MSWLLPYLGISLLLLSLMARWAFQVLRRHTQAHVELVELKRNAPPLGTHTQRQLADKIFDSRDWDFISRRTSPEIQKAFQTERAFLAIAWLQRAKREISHVMKQHAKATRRSENLELYTETKLVLTHFFFVLLCNCLIALIWFRGAFATRQIVLRALHLNLRLRSNFENLILTLDSARPICSDKNLGRRAI
jgi:hypothetical protein